MFLATAILPIYIWSSGGLQPSHILLGIYCGALLLARGVGRGLPDTILLVLAFFVLARESISVFVDGSAKSLIPAAHVIYSLLVFNALRRAITDERIRHLVLAGVLVSAAIAVVGVLSVGYTPIISSEIERPIGTFNNPNQLGYYSVCLFSFAYLYRLRFQIDRSYLIFLTICSVFLAIASLSKAAMIAVALPMLFVGFSPQIEVSNTGTRRCDHSSGLIGRLLDLYDRGFG